MKNSVDAMSLYNRYENGYQTSFPFIFPLNYLNETPRLIQRSKIQASGFLCESIQPGITA
jgi:hypothetical protein